MVNAQIPVISGLSAEQVNQFQILMANTINAALDKYFPMPQQEKNMEKAITKLASQPPATIQLATQRSTQLAIQPSTQPAPIPQLAQKEKEAEKSMRSRKSITSNMGLLSTILHQASMPDDGKASLSGSKAVITSEAIISSIPIYIRHPKDLEATGQG